MTSVDGPAPTQREPRPRRPRTPRKKTSQIPVTIRYGVPLMLALLAAQLWWAYGRTVPLEIAVVDDSGVILPEARIELFSFEDGPASASPSRKLGELEIVDGQIASVPVEWVERDALARIEADGFGVSFAYVERTDSLHLIDIGPVAEVSGSVVDTDGKPIADATVHAYGGGPHGVLLVETQSDALGQFTVSGFSESLGYVHLRVFARGYAVGTAEGWIVADKPPQAKLVASKPVRGRVVLPEGLTAEGLRVRAVGVPGVQTDLAPDGSFELHHLPPPPNVVALIVDPLPEAWTHRKVTSAAGEEAATITIEPSATVTGQVINPLTGVGASAASVIHEHGPNGREAVRCDRKGYFTIGRLPPGPVTLRGMSQHAAVDQFGRDTMGSRVGDRDLDLLPGETRTGVALEVY